MGKFNNLIAWLQPLMYKCVPGSSWRGLLDEVLKGDE